MTTIHTLDLHFRNKPESIASYLIPYTGGAVLVDPGPASTLPAMEAELAACGMDLAQITHVLITHIHFDHAGAAGTLAQRGVQVLVHPVGAPHLLDPTKLINSATRLYGDKMDELWGAFLPVPPERLTEVQDGVEFQIGELRFTGLHTPGHAEHHVAYLFEDAVFTGDVAGVRLPGPFYLRLPFVPPETHLEKWAASLKRIRATGARRVIPTHFGIFPDAEVHLAFALDLLAATSTWLEGVMATRPDVAMLSRLFDAWMTKRGREAGLTEELLAAYESEGPNTFAATGLERYWRKVRNAPEEM